MQISPQKCSLYYFLYVHYNRLVLCVSSIANPETAVMNKITEEHISQFLTGSREEMQYSYKEKSQKKIFTLLALVLVMAFCVIIICLLKDSPDIMEKVLYTVGGVVAGAFGGYGYGKNRREDD